MLWIRAFTVWLIIMVVESLHGTLRTLFLEPWLGSFRARQISVFTGCLMFLGITLLFIRWIRVESAKLLIAIGFFWIVLTVLFEFTLVRSLLGFTWERAVEDFDLSRGGLMIFGLLFMLFTPLLAAKLRGIKRTATSF